MTAITGNLENCVVVGSFQKETFLVLEIRKGLRCKSVGPDQMLGIEIFAVEAKDRFEEERVIDPASYDPAPALHLRNAHEPVSFGMASLDLDQDVTSLGY